MLVRISLTGLIFLFCLSAVSQEPTQVQSLTDVPKTPLPQSTPVIHNTTNNQYTIETGTVTEVSVDDQKLIIEYKEPPKTIHRGDRLFITTRHGSSCIVAATDIENTVVTAIPDACPDFEFVVVGDQAKKSRIAKTTRKAVPGSISRANTESKFNEQGFAALLSYSFTTTTYLTGSASGFPATETDTLGGAFGLNAEYYMLHEQGVGFMGGLTYEFARTDTGATATVGNVTVTEAYTNAPQYAVIIPYANINYMFTQYIYTLGGLNYNFISATNTQGATYTGQLGYQLGVGSILDSHWGVELQYRWLNFTGSGVSGVNITGITFNGLLFKAGYYF